MSGEVKTNLGPDPNTRVPAFEMPENACDAHCHVFGPGGEFPFAPERTYTPPDAGKAQLAALHAKLGIARAVLVQASCHGTDNTAMLDAIAHSAGRVMGVAMVGDDVTDAELQALHDGGVRGVRFNFVRHLGGAPDLRVFHSVVERVREMGWHLVLHLDAEDIADHVGLFRPLRLPKVIDHMGRVHGAGGTGQPAYRALLEFLRDETVWVKVSGAERVSDTGPPFDDAVPIARGLIAAAPERVLWGTDYPHPNMGPAGAPNDGDLVDLVPKFAPDEGLRRKLLVENPARLYGFPD